MGLTTLSSSNHSLSRLQQAGIKPASDVDTPTSGSPRQSPGQLPRDVYDAILPWWRSRIRNMVLKAVKRESPFLAEMQVNTVRPI